MALRHVGVSMVRSCVESQAANDECQIVLGSLSSSLSVLELFANMLLKLLDLWRALLLDGTIAWARHRWESTSCHRTLLAQGLATLRDLLQCAGFSLPTGVQLGRK